MHHMHVGTYIGIVLELFVKILYLGKLHSQNSLSRITLFRRPNYLLLFKITHNSDNPNTEWRRLRHFNIVGFILLKNF